MSGEKNDTATNNDICLKCHWLVQSICIFGCMLFLWLFGLMIILNNSFAAIIFLLFVLLGMYSYITTTYTTCISDDVVESVKLFQTHKIEWSEIVGVETNETTHARIGNVCILNAKDKRFVIELTPWMMNRNAAKARIAHSLNQRHIPITPLNTLSLKNRNTRVAGR